MKNLISLAVLSTVLLSGCGNKDKQENKSPGPAPAPAEVIKPKEDKDPKNSTLTPDVLTPPGKEVPPRPTVVTPVSLGNEMATPSEENRSYSNAAQTGASAAPNMEYISLINDGLMDALKRHLSFDGKEQLESNKKFAAKIVNGKMSRDVLTGDVWVTLKIKEGQHVRNYRYSVAPLEERMAPMIREQRDSIFEGRHDLKASFMCAETSGDCEVGVVKLEGEKAVSMMVLRRQKSDLHVSMKNKNIENSDLQKIDQFFENSAVVYKGEEQVDSAYVDTFEVAFGVSLLRTLVIGKNNEIIAHAGSLVSSAGSVNWKMRPLQRESEDIDLIELAGRTTFMSSTIGTTSLRKVEDNGAVLISYRMRSQTRAAKDEFTITFKPKPVSLVAVDYMEL